MRILLTGCTGFAGGYLTEALLAQGEAELFGLSRRGAWSVHWQHLQGRVALQAADLCDLAGTEKILREVQPERIFHLAGYARVRESFAEVEAAWASNLTATRTLYEAVLRWGGRPRILWVGSGLVYGDPQTEGQLFDENCLLRPVSPYAASKAAADLTSYQYSQAPGLDIVRARPFNHIGPHQGTEFAVPNFARQLAAIERGQQPPQVETGNLTTCRDLTDVRDMVRAYLLLMEKGQRGEAYNVGTGQAHTMQEVLDKLLALAPVNVEVRKEAKLLRAHETVAIRADASKLRKLTGWSPRYTLDQTLSDTLEYWRSAAQV